MNKFIIYSFLFVGSLWSSDYAYLDKNYAEAEIIYKKYWEKSGDIKHLRSYIKTLIRQNKYKKSLEIIQLTRLDDKYITYLKNYCNTALNNFEDLENSTQNEKLIDYINIKKSKKTNINNDLSRLLNLDDFESIESPFYKLYYLVQKQDIKEINSFIVSNYQDLRSANKNYQWLALFEAYKILKSHNEMIAEDIKDFIVHNCKILDIRKLLESSFYSDDKYAMYAEKIFSSFTNTQSFEKLSALSQEGKISKKDLSLLVKLNPNNQENFYFIKASMERSPKLFLQLYEDYKKDKYLYYMFISCLQKKNSFELVYSYREELLKHRKILFSYINYLQFTDLETYSNIKKLEIYIHKQDKELLNNYGRLVYKHDKGKALSIWKSNPNPAAHSYILYHDFNSGYEIKLDEEDKENKNLLALEGILEFRKKNYKYLLKDFPEDEYLYPQHLFLRSIFLSQSADFSGASKLLDPNSPNPYIAGKSADFLFLLYGLENNVDHLDLALSIYKNLPPNKIYEASLRYKIFNCLREKNEEQVILDFIEDKLFSIQLDPKNYYDRRLLYDVYRYCYSKNYISFCESISNKYGIKP
ncbi:hypothetical protein PQO03_11200 [Lentisphaera profundi]|uniref:Transglycosylase SLT domain-containing protein n=1 Tax=Lentisphaera profundi TaxID=1658616 RepID=A0ABY7VRD2_9BACT|nr:hypothetical protein [Lentisphaera profundi]WDE96274.1 hypothetical protein PQO03_11200 [Lentisphaera profundi]